MRRRLAARFVNPIFSSDVSVATNSARIRNWYEFISIYYRLNILCTAFVTSMTTRGQYP